MSVMTDAKVSKGVRKAQNSVSRHFTKFKQLFLPLAVRKFNGQYSVLDPRIGVGYLLIDPKTGHFKNTKTRACGDGFCALFGYLQNVTIRDAARYLNQIDW